MKTTLLLAATLLFPEVLLAQFEDFDADLNVKRALSYSFGDVIIDQSFHDQIQLEEDQVERITELRAKFLPQYKELIRESLGLAPGERPEGDLLVFAERQTPEMQAELRKQERLLEERVRDELTPKQIELAEGIVLRERIRLGGIPALVASQDLSLVKEAGFDSQLATIRARFGKASDNINKELKQLERELQEIHLKYQAKIEEIKKREFDAALDDLGPDGERLKDIIATAEGINK
jgi:hypothetical protein